MSELLDRSKRKHNYIRTVLVTGRNLDTRYRHVIQATVATGTYQSGPHYVTPTVTPKLHASCGLKECLHRGESKQLNDAWRRTNVLDFSIEHFAGSSCLKFP